MESQAESVILLTKIKGNKRLKFSFRNPNKLLLTFTLSFGWRIVLSALPEFTRVLLTDLTNGRSPLILIDRFRSYCAVPNANWFRSNSNQSPFHLFVSDIFLQCSFCASDLPYGKEALTLSTKSRAHRLGHSPFHFTTLKYLLFFNCIRNFTNTNYETLCFGWVPLSVVMLRVMLIVQKLLQENKHSSKRDIYYTYPSLFLGEFRFAGWILFFTVMWEPLVGRKNRV